MRATGEDARVRPEQLDELCPDWRDRQTYACGPGAMLEAFEAHFNAAGIAERMHVESFEHLLIGGVTGDGGTVTFTGSGVTAECDGRTPILVAGEAAGAVLPYGCRMGICHTCIGKLSSGSVRDLRTGDVTGAGTEIRTCLNCPDGPVTIEL
ncbi:flavin reductase family protein [Mycolicibacterium lutetiense]|nr:iron-sulfur cluster-binding domain-containing protein [Mycolicibacterium lutetiense]MBP2452161.1 ferredoxin [Mycolicibacterium lutetiense]